MASIYDEIDRIKKEGSVYDDGYSVEGGSSGTFRSPNRNLKAEAFSQAPPRYVGRGYGLDD